MTGDCYCNVLRAAVRRLTARYDAALEPVGIGVAQFALMRRIAEAGRPSVTELARLSDLDRSTVGRNVRVLERMGLAVTGSGLDQRESVVELTAAGRDKLVQAVPLWNRAQAAVDDALGGAEAAALKALVARL